MARFSCPSPPRASTRRARRRSRRSRRHRKPESRASVAARSKSSSGRFVARKMRPVRGRGSPGLRSRWRRCDRRGVTRLPRRAPPARPARRPPGLSTRFRASTLPSRSTRPERIFVPPTSTPITRGALTAAGYHSAPDARRRQALPAIPRRPREGQSPSGQGQARGVVARRDAEAPRSHAAGDAGSRSPLVGLVAPPRLGRPRLHLVRSRRRRRQRAASAACERQLVDDERLAALRPVDDPHDRHRRRKGSWTARRAALGLAPPPTHGAGHGTGSRTSRSPRPAGRHPRLGSSKINAANQFGGPALTIATVRELTGLAIDHVVVFDFDGFRELIDAIGGVEIDVPRRIQSNGFDCPYKPARCRAGTAGGSRRGSSTWTAGARSSTPGSARTS